MRSFSIRILLFIKESKLLGEAGFKKVYLIVFPAVLGLSSKNDNGVVEEVCGSMVVPGYGNRSLHIGNHPI